MSFIAGWLGFGGGDKGEQSESKSQDTQVFTCQGISELTSSDQRRKVPKSVFSLYAASGNKTGSISHYWQLEAGDVLCRGAIDANVLPFRGRTSDMFGWSWPGKGGAFITCVFKTTEKDCRAALQAFYMCNAEVRAQKPFDKLGRDNGSLEGGTDLYNVAMEDDSGEEEFSDSDEELERELLQEQVKLRTPQPGSYSTPLMESKQASVHRYDLSPGNVTPPRSTPRISRLSDRGGLIQQDTPSRRSVTSELKGDHTKRILRPGMSKAAYSFVVRGNNVGVYRDSTDGGAEFVHDLRGIKDKRGDAIEASDALLHNQTERMVLLSKKKSGTMYDVDLETGKVVSEWQADKDSDMAVRDISTASKFAEMGTEQTLLASNKASIMRLDPRLNSNSKVAEVKTYKRAPKFQCIATTEGGQAAVGSETGEIRLYNKIGKRAATLFPGIGYEIKGLDVTADGKWILATCPKRLLLLKTDFASETKKKGSFRTNAFLKTMPSNKRGKCMSLTLAPEDLSLMGVANMDFTHARFHSLPNSGSSDAIVTSVGSYLVMWDFTALRRGKSAWDTYTYRRKDQNGSIDQIISAQFSYVTDKKIVTMGDSGESSVSLSVDQPVSVKKQRRRKK